MKTRVLSIVMAVTLVSLSTGCSGMRNFMFGRGARCGLCQRLSTAGQALNPLAPAPYAPAPETGRGPAPCPPQQDYGWRGGPAGGYAGGGYSGGPCSSGCVGSGYANRGNVCGDGVVRGYGSVSDPYLGGQPYFGAEVPYDGQIIEGPVLSDDWDRREGEVIQPESLPPGVQNQQ